MNTSNLVRAFDRAGLVLKLSKEPFRKGQGMEAIVQIDIQRSLSGTQRGEWFRLYPGGNNAEITVRDTDKDHGQLVLMVREPEQEFEETVWKQARDSTPYETWVKVVAQRSGGRLVRRVSERRRDGAVIARKTDANMRYFLMGVDERQLFIAQLTGAATTVDGARKLLGKTVEFAEGKRRGSSLDRQGEWFFLETSQAQRDYLDRMIKQSKIAVQKKVPIPGRAGKPHTADELILLQGSVVANRLGHGFPVRDRQVYIRGSVRHSDHKTVRFSEWREVILNNEGATARASASGVFWVD